MSVLFSRFHQSLVVWVYFPCSHDPCKYLYQEFGVMLYSVYLSLCLALSAFAVIEAAGACLNTYMWPGGMGLKVVNVTIPHTPLPHFSTCRFYACYSHSLSVFLLIIYHSAAHVLSGCWPLISPGHRCHDRLHTTCNLTI